MISDVVPRLLYLVLIVVVAGASVGAAQEESQPARPSGTGTGATNRGWMAAAERWFDSDDSTVPTFAVVFGGIKPGSGPAGGGAVGHSFSDGSLVQARAEYSIHDYKLLQSRYQSRPFGRAQAIVLTRVRWQDAPSVALYDLGRDSPKQRALYAERKMSYSAEVMLRPLTMTRVGAGIGYERYRVGNGRTDPEEDESLSVVPQLPGLGLRSGFLHSFVAAGVDTRPSGDVSRRGSHVNAALHRFSDRDGGTYSFGQFVAEGEHLVPVAGDRGAVSLAGNVWASRGAAVPFFLMPTLGGGDYLRGYRTYRFRDRDAAVMTAQFQWRVQEWIDAAVFADLGSVAPRLSSLRLRASRPTEGIGLRVRTPKKTIFRLDLARSAEGLQLLVGFASRASAVF